MHELDEVIKHYGIPGMKWGVRRENTGFRGKLRSARRERQWKRVLREVDELSTSEILQVSKRVSLENDLKALSKRVGKKRDKRDYLNREYMTNEELSLKVTRLRAIDNLKKGVDTATKEQRELGQKVVQAGGALSIKYAMTKKIEPSDIFNAVKNPKQASENAQKDLLKETLKKVKEYKR